MNRIDWVLDQADLERSLAAARDAVSTQLPSAPSISSVAADDQSANELRPATFEGIVGQVKVKRLIARMVEAAQARQRPLDHVLLVGPSGTGKTTFAHVIARAMGTQVIQLEAPISMDTLVELSQVMNDGDVLFLDEIHQQSLGDRRGRSSSTQPEVLFSVMEDRTLPTGNGVLAFPHVTVMGATTDEGMLPDAFINRFPIRPRLERYTVGDMREIALRNAASLGIGLELGAAEMFAKASRGVPREVNNYVKNAASLTGFRVDRQLASEVLFDLNGVTEDGLTRDMQELLIFLYTRCRRESKGEVRYQASISSIATAIGKSRDQKAVQLRVEPYLIEQGYIQVAHGGRVLTQAGIIRAINLTEGR